MTLIMNTNFTGQTVADRYDVRERIGSGNMGHVFLAWDNRLETDIVLKVPTLARLENAEFRQRFLQESRFLVKLNHPRIVHILDVGEHGGVPFFAMQFVGGGSLESRIHPTPGHSVSQPLATLSDWVPGTAEALDFMHTKGYVHRDIKPANILYDTYGNAYLSDFGLSKILGGSDQGDSSMTAAGAIVGTPNYVAPEVVLGLKYDGKADQYSLAMTIYEALTGRCPLQGPTPSATMVNQTTKSPPPPHEINFEIPEEISRVILRGLEKPPAKRFQNCRDLAHALRDIAGLSLAAGRNGSGPLAREDSLKRLDSGRTTALNDDLPATKRFPPENPKSKRLVSNESRPHQSASTATGSNSSTSRKSNRTSQSSRSTDISSQSRTSASRSLRHPDASRSETSLPPLPYRLVATSQVLSGIAECPKCQTDLKIKAEYAGRKGKCIRCSANLLIARNLKTISYVKLSPQTASSQDDQYHLVIGTEVFGFRLKKWQALTLVCCLAISITGAALYLFYSSRQSEADRQPVNKFMESSSDISRRSQPVEESSRSATTTNFE